MSNNSVYILLVDDDATNLLLLEELLDSEGYVTRSALSAAEALEIVAQSVPALIVLDVMMPDMDGFELCDRLRSDEELQGIPIIFLTALDDDRSRLKGLELMGDDYLTKPINIPLLLTKIASLLRLQQLRETQLSRKSTQQVERLACDIETRSIATVKEQTQQQLDVAWQISEQLTEKFRLFVPEQFLNRIAPQGVESIQLGNGKEEELTVLFCDIRGFTAIAESQPATATFAWLNAFFTQMNQAIARHHGFIDKYLGDAIMAVFDRDSHHSEDGLKAAIAMQETLAQFNDRRSQFNLVEPVRIGIGVHTGKGVMGTIGSDRRMDSTVIGDVVNTASRIEDLTKVYGISAIVSEALVQRLPEPQSYHLRYIDRVALRGKQQTTGLYEVVLD